MAESGRYFLSNRYPIDIKPNRSQLGSVNTKTSGVTPQKLSNFSQRSGMPHSKASNSQKPASSMHSTTKSHTFNLPKHDQQNRQVLAYKDFMRQRKSPVKKNNNIWIAPVHQDFEQRLPNDDPNYSLSPVARRAKEDGSLDRA